MSNYILTFIEAVDLFYQDIGVCVTPKNVTDYAAYVNNHDDLQYFIIIGYYDAEETEIYEFTFYSANPYYGCFLKALLMVYSDKLTLQHKNNPDMVCQGRTQTEADFFMLRIYDTAVNPVVYYGSFLINSALNYSAYYSYADVDCNSFDTSFAFTGGTCQNAINLFKGIIKNKGATFYLSLKTDVIESVEVIMNEYTEYLWVFGVIAGCLLVVITVVVVLMLRAEH